MLLLALSFMWTTFTFLYVSAMFRSLLLIFCFMFCFALCLFLKFRSLLSSLCKLHLCYCMLLLCFEVTSLFSGLVLSFCYAFVKFRSLLSIVCLLFCFILCFCFLSQYAPYFPISLLLYVMLCLSYVYCFFALMLCSNVLFLLCFCFVCIFFVFCSAFDLNRCSCLFLFHVSHLFDISSWFVFCFAFLYVFILFCSHLSVWYVSLCWILICFPLFLSLICFVTAASLLFHWATPRIGQLSWLLSWEVCN